MCSGHLLGITPYTIRPPLVKVEVSCDSLSSGYQVVKYVREKYMLVVDNTSELSTPSQPVLSLLL